MELEAGGDPALPLGAGSGLGRDKRASVGRTGSTGQEESGARGRGRAVLTGT